VATEDSAPVARFTGINRHHGNRRAVRFADLVSRAIITVGGFGTIVAVLLVCVFLFAVAGDLFRPATVGAGIDLPTASPAAVPVATGTDEYRLIAWVITADGRLQSRTLAGEPLADHQLLSTPPTCWSRSPSRLLLPQEGTTVGGTEDIFAAGFADGSARLVTVRYRTILLPPTTVALAPGERRVWDGGVAELTPLGQVRHQVLSTEVGDPLTLADRPLALLAHRWEVNDDSGRKEVRLAAVDETATLHAIRLRRRGGDGPWTTRLGHSDALISRGLPAGLLFADGGQQLHVVWQDGHAERFAIGDPTAITPRERVDLLFDSDGQVTALGMLVGGNTLLVGDSTGGIAAWFLARTEDREPSTAVDGWRYNRGHRYATGEVAAITGLAASTRSRFFVAAHADGTLHGYNATNERRLFRLDAGGPVAATAIGAKEDGVTAATATGLRCWEVDPAHHEMSLSAVFLPVHYEGYDSPRQMWQSGAGEDTSEPKLGLWVLICGTLKATIYSVLFGVPIALFAALYTAEFMHPRARNIVKPSLEFMASLPSVILGFVAALIIAGWVERHLCAVFVGIVLVPLALLGGAQGWLLIPSRLSRRWPLLRLPAIAAAIIGAVAASFWLGDRCEQWFFTVDLMRDGVMTRSTGLVRWLNTEQGISSPFGGWFFLFLPLVTLTVGLGSVGMVKPFLRRWSLTWSERKTALASLLHWVLMVALALGLAAGLAALAGLVADPRDFIIGRFAQRNALVVGFVMGFAIIPIIYTIAEDALSSVPETLRSASLGAGATPWQTAIRVVIPAAMSGIFSAIMIGIGRAVGETMIVLMAAGNAPLTEFNLLNGMRTLSANIATEIPEAVKGSTHYRLLFFSGLLLFAMTFVLNTVSEMIRMRFRQKAKQL
jgi:phosphate transport system permease protein